jgi:two-component system, chemotaxis family, sensor kinase CheA
MNDTTIHTLSPAFRMELETLRDQRDLYRSLLLSEPAALERGMNQGLACAQQIQSLLRAPTRDGAAFRGKIDQLLGELAMLEEGLIDLHLPTVNVRLHSAQQALREIEVRTEITGNDLLPAMVVLGDLCSHITIAADCAAVHVPLIEEEHVTAAVDPEASQRRVQPQLLIALQQLHDKLAQEHRKNVALVALGLEDIPETWIGALFDMLGQLMRNAIEHGIETPEQRAAKNKPEQGTVVVEFGPREDEGYELSVHDDGRGLDAEKIAQCAVSKGLLTSEAAENIDNSRLVGLIFQPGLSTAEDSARRGQGMQIVRDHIQRLGGRIQAATKNGQYTRYRIQLPAIPTDDAQMSRHA